MSNKQAKTLLKEYGYEEVAENVYKPARPSSDIWVYDPEKEGFYMFAMVTGGIAGGNPWGRITKDTPAGYMQVPFTQKETFKDVGGLHPGNKDHEDFFEWLWPEWRVQQIYDFAVPAGDNPYVKVTDKDGNETIELKKGTKPPGE